MSVDSDTVRLFMDRHLTNLKTRLTVDLAALIGSSVMAYRAGGNSRENRTR